MVKKVNYSWPAQRITINFNQKQWRQDFAAYVAKKRFWFRTSVSRSLAISRKRKDKGIKQFDVFGSNPSEIFNIKFTNNNEIIECSDKELMNNYFIEKGLNEN